jgi:hypothetical protein
MAIFLSLKWYDEFFWSTKTLTERGVSKQFVYEITVQSKATTYTGLAHVFLF